MKIVADARKDEEAWLEARRRFITASDIFKILTDFQLDSMGWWKESFMKEGLEEALHNKLTRSSPEFSDPVAVKWGQVEEDHNRERFSEYSGIPTWGCHYLVGAERWPHLATTLDGFGLVEAEWEGLASPEMFGGKRGFSAFSTEEQVVRAIDKLPREERFLVEMKSTSEWGGKAWFSGYDREPKDRAKKSKVVAGTYNDKPPGAPVYYRGQIQTQMAFTGIPWNLAVVRSGHSHMTAHAYRANKRWEMILDEVEALVAEPVDELRREIDGE